jgi:hypothetical protein
MNSRAKAVRLVRLLTRCIATFAKPREPHTQRKGIQMYDIISVTIGGVISLPIVGFILLVSAVV